MKLRVLGCSGGIGGNLHTTSFLLDHDVLIDAGTGVGVLSLTELSRIDHVFVTHSHLDHITSIPFLVDSVGFMRDRPLTVYALEDTIEILRQHIFNWKIWPDFCEIPSDQQPYLRYQAISLGETITLGERKITSIPANHVVPSVGYHLDSGQASLVFSGDTTINPALWTVINNIRNLKYFFIETAFSNSEKELAVMSKHLCPSMLAEELLGLRKDAEIFITHLKPGELELTMSEIEMSVGKLRSDLNIKMLLNNQIFEF